VVASGAAFFAAARLDARTGAFASWPAAGGVCTVASLAGVAFFLAVMEILGWGLWARIRRARPVQLWRVSSFGKPTTDGSGYGQGVTPAKVKTALRRVAGVPCVGASFAMPAHIRKFSDARIEWAVRRVEGSRHRSHQIDATACFSSCGLYQCRRCPAPGMLTPRRLQPLIPHAPAGAAAP
jgi:hypothetical protein